MKEILNIGDKVKIIIHEDMNKTGVIVNKGDLPTVTTREVLPKKKPAEETQTSWWIVKLDETGEEKEFPDDILENIG